MNAPIVQHSTYVGTAAVYVVDLGGLTSVFNAIGEPRAIGRF